MRGRRRHPVATALALFAAGVVAACTCSVPPDGAPPDRWGYWAVWSPAADADPPTDTLAIAADRGVFVWTRYKVVGDRLDRGESVAADELDRLPAGIGLSLWVSPDDPPAIVALELLASCATGWYQERATLDPPLVVDADGAVAWDDGMLSWEARLSGSEGIRGTWRAEGCGGSWEGDGAGTGTGEGWTRFYPEVLLERPWYEVAAWGVELTTVGRHLEESLDLCVTVVFDQPNDLDAWLELEFGRGGFLAGDVVLGCNGHGVDLLVDAGGELLVIGFGLSGTEIDYQLTATVTGTVALHRDGHPPLMSTFTGSSSGVVRGENPPAAALDRLYQDALACGLSPVFAAWWGTDESGPTPIVHPFFDPPRCS